MERCHAGSLVEWLHWNDCVGLSERPHADRLSHVADCFRVHSCATCRYPQTCPLTITTSPGDFIRPAGLILLGFASLFQVAPPPCSYVAGLAFSCALLFGVTGCGSGGNSQWNPLTPKAHISGDGSRVVREPLRTAKQITVVVQ